LRLLSAKVAMANSQFLGLALVVAGGVGQGAFMAPTKWMRNWRWENYWLIFSLTAYLIVPWSIALLTIPKLFDIYAGSTAGALLSVVVFGSAWGVGALTFGLGVDALGVALGFAIILGAATTVGTLIPLLLAPPPNFSSLQLLLTVLSLTIMLGGVVLCSFAGKWKEGGASRPKNYNRGVLICVVSGILSSCGNLGLTFAGSITKRALELGVPGVLAPNAVWTLLTVPLFLCNFTFALSLLNRNKTGIIFRATRWRNLALAVSMGVLWMGGLALYGSGARKLGQMGTSLGFAIFMSSTVLVASTVGIASGEWKNSPPQATRQMTTGVLLLVVAICCLSALNR
jgi:L-rhamnose-H+ transport protein